MHGHDEVQMKLVDYLDDQKRRQARENKEDESSHSLSAYLKRAVKRRQKTLKNKEALLNMLKESIDEYFENKEHLAL